MSNQPKRIELVTTYFEMHAPPVRTRGRACPPGLTVRHVEKPAIEFYRYLYDTVGGPWVWWERKLQSDKRIAEDLHHPLVDLYVPYLNDEPIGMSEVDWRHYPDVKLPYFGITPEHCGLGIGGYLLDWTIDQVFALGAKRFWLTTCSLDSPRAIPAYERAGFTAFKVLNEEMDDPAVSLAIKPTP